LLPPGLERLCLGVNATIFDTFPPDPTAANSFVHTVFDFTCDQKKKWTNPYTNQVYDLPDQVAYIVKEDGRQMNKKIDFHRDYQNIRNPKQAKAVGGFLHFLVTPNLPKI
jgi:hypothetical protein